MPAVLTLGGIALAVLGLLIAFAGMPSWSSGLGLGSDLIQAGASLLAGGLIVSALGVVLNALRELSDRLEDAGLGYADGRPSLNDDLAEQTPRSLPRASARNATTSLEDELDESPPPSARTSRSLRPPVPAARSQRPGAEALKTQSRMPIREEGFEREDDEEFAAEFPSRRQEPRWMRTQAESADSQSQRPGSSPAQLNRPSRATPVAPPSPPRRETAPTSFESAPRAQAASPAYEAPSRRQPSAYENGPRRRTPVEPEPHDDEPAEATVVRSGIIAGMAYTLYSDGSIEAELPAGTVRFASIAELQEHVKRAGADDEQGDRGPNSSSN